jgi:hypothetical protein
MWSSTGSFISASNPFGNGLNEMKAEFGNTPEIPYPQNSQFKTNNYMQNPTILARCELHPNERKLYDTHPDLKSVVRFDDTAYDIAVWTRTTKAGDRMYHSLTIREPCKKGRKEQPVPIVKAVNLYEFRKRSSADPDYQSAEAVSILGTMQYLALFIKRDGDDMTFDLQFLDRPYTSALSGAAAHTLAALRQSLAARNSQLIQDDTDDIEMNEMGEPSKLPF